MSTTFACQPGKPETVPWQAGCDICQQLKAEPEPGLYTWVMFVCQHMEEKHGLVLVGS